MNASVAVSYVIPVHNGERYLARCIESVLGQTVPPLEVIVVDDGSTDGSSRVATGFGRCVRRIEQPHAGQSAARNAGAGVAEGSFLAFLDADDLIHPEKLERQLERFAARPDLQLCDAYMRNFWSPDVPKAERRILNRQRFTHGETPRAHNIITWLLRRELFEESGGFDERMTMGEDTDWYERVQGSGAAIETIDEVLALRRLYGGNLTLRRYDEFLHSIVKSTKRRVVSAGRTYGSR